MHRRPSGVTLSAVVLGIFSAFLFFGGLFDAVVGVLFISSPGLVPNTPSQPAPPPNLLPLTFGFMALMTLICAVWGFSTCVGLTRMRRWARISIMIIGVCVAGLSLIELFGCIIIQLTMTNFALPPNAGSAGLVPPNPEALRGAFFLVDALCIGLISIGVWWVVYFALRCTRDAFERVALSPALSSTAQLNPSTPITDFSVAQPRVPAQTPATAPATIAASADETPGRPITMVVIAVLMLLIAVSMLFCCALPYPLFFFGIQFNGWSAHSIAISMAVLYALAAYGLLRRMHFGWLLAIGMQCLGLLNALTLLSPQVRDHWVAYTRTLTHSMMPPMPTSAGLPAQMLQERIMNFTLIPSLGIGIVIALVVLVLLWRARWWYRSSQQ